MIKKTIRKGIGKILTRFPVFDSDLGFIIFMVVMFAALFCGGYFGMKMVGSHANAQGWLNQPLSNLKVSHFLIILWVYCLFTDKSE